MINEPNDTCAPMDDETILQQIHYTECLGDDQDVLPRRSEEEEDAEDMAIEPCFLEDEESNDVDSIRPSVVPRTGTSYESNRCGLVSPIDIGTLLTEPEELVPWVLEGYLAQGRITLLAGPPKLGKTTLGYQAITHIAAGQQFLNCGVLQGKVLVLD